MASISRDDNGNCLLQIVGPDKVRRSVRLGKMTQKQADQVRLRVEAIDASRRAKLPLDPDAASWLGGIGDDLAKKLAAVGLIPERRSQTVGPFLDSLSGPPGGRQQRGNADQPAHGGERRARLLRRRAPPAGHHRGGGD